jgi:serine/threonine protein kinase
MRSIDVKWFCVSNALVVGLVGGFSWSSAWKICVPRFVKVMLFGSDEFGGGQAFAPPPPHVRSSSTWSVYDDCDMFAPAPSLAEGVDAEPKQVCRELKALKKVSVLQRGSQGVVYSAHDPERGELVAVKRLFCRTNECGVAESILREVTLLRSLRHANVLALHDVVLGPEGEVCLVLEHCPFDISAVTLRRRAPLPLPVARRVLLDVVAGLAFIHDRGVLHRDLKASNVMVAADGVAKLADFGSARATPPQGHRLTPAGGRVTLVYRPPEVLLGSVTYGPAIDMWMLGVLAVELLTGDYLFKATSEFQMIKKVFELVGTPTDETWPGFSALPVCTTFRFGAVEGSWSPLASLPLEAADLVRSLLSANPAQRPSAADVSRHPFFHAVGVASHEEVAEALMKQSQLAVSKPFARGLQLAEGSDSE